MTNSKYTPEGLPVVSKDTLNVYLRDALQRLSEGERSLIEYQEEAAGIIKKHNLILWEEMMEYSVANFDSALEKATFLVGCLTCYDLLRIQAEKNKLEELYKEK